jgi:hypothetical protein
LGQHAQELLVWFSAVEERAWAWVNATAYRRPTCIFLVTGQILTDEYAISHQQSGSLTCSVSVGANVEVPNVISSDVLLGTAFKKVEVGPGFQLRMEKSPNDVLHSIFLKVRESKPISRMRKKGLAEKLSQLHKQRHDCSNADYCRDFVKTFRSDTSKKDELSPSYLKWPENTPQNVMKESFPSVLSNGTAASNRAHGGWRKPRLVSNETWERGLCCEVRR